MKITAIRVSEHEIELDPPMHAAWDPDPRRRFAATVVRVETDEGVVGIGSGDTMAGFAPHVDHFLGTDPLAIEPQVPAHRVDRVPRRPVLAARGGAVGHRRAGGRAAGLGAVRRRGPTAAVYASWCSCRPRDGGRRTRPSWSGRASAR